MKTTIIYLAIVAASLTGYIKGIIKLTECDFKPSYKAEVIYIFGAATGLNCVLGYFDFGK